MRIIAGKLRGKQLKGPKSQKIRPTEDRIKENIFNVIGPYFHGEKILDLFSGSGAVGLEFLSRGAQFCVFVDASRQAHQLTKDNIKACKMEEFSEVFLGDYQEALKNLGSLAYRFDQIYIDPPYKNYVYYDQSLKKIKDLDLLQEDGQIILEMEKDLDLSLGEDWTLKKEKIYRDTRILVVENK
ncbi:MAG: 16S rRNA (guanine(966)-N(2))-methyltransferase RsmD [Tissierellia bacterium]|nr:16S rRNA (guanine(966)-N(2))-methyltransferase RsmD [Tissierellia bacterium]